MPAGISDFPYNLIREISISPGCGPPTDHSARISAENRLAKNCQNEASRPLCSSARSGEPILLPALPTAFGAKTDERFAGALDGPAANGKTRSAIRRVVHQPGLFISAVRGTRFSFTMRISRRCSVGDPHPSTRNISLFKCGMRSARLGSFVDLRGDGDGDGGCDGDGGRICARAIRRREMLAAKPARPR